VASLLGTAAGLPASDRLLLFAINTHSKWSSPSENEFDIAIDVTGSPAPEFFVVGVDLGAVLAGAFNGQYGSFVFDAAGNVLDAFFADAPSNGSAVVLPVAASSIGLSLEEHDHFRYTTVGFDILEPVVDVTAGNPRFWPWEPRLAQGGFLALAPGASADVSLTALSSAVADSALGWMVVAHDDADGATQADLVPLPPSGRGRP
jgi:hypothetical protein